MWLTCCALAASAPSGAEAYNFAVSLARQGPRPAASAAERRAHQRVAARFRAVGLRVGYERFGVPGKGTSRDVIGIKDAPGDCLVIAMAHADSVPPAPGADDNASGVGALVALARALGTEPTPSCDVWRWRRARRSGRTRARAITSGRARSSPACGARIGSTTSGSRCRSTRSAGAPASICTRRRRAAGGRRAADRRRRRRPRPLGARPRRRGQLRPSRARARSGAPAAKLGVVDDNCRHTAHRRG